MRDKPVRLTTYQAVELNSRDAPMCPKRALYGSALWGIWHLPVAFVALGVLTIPYLVIVHTAIGYFLVTSWRRTGNLAAPGIAHAVIDALRNAVAVLESIVRADQSE